MKFPGNKKRFIPLSLVIISMLVTYLVSVFPPVRHLDLKVLDQHFSLRGPAANRDTSIVIVAIDDQTFASMPVKWPFPRSFYAKLISNLKEAGAKLIVFDMEFSNPYQDDLRQDSLLARTAKEAGNVIFAGKMVTEFGRSGTLNQYVLPPIPLLADPKGGSASPWGLVNIVEDDDGFLRRYFLMKEVSQRRYYPLAVLAAKKLLGIPDSAIIDRGDRYVFGDRIIPKASPETMQINYVGPAKSFHTYSFVNILDDFEFDLGEEEDTDIFELHKMWGTFQDKIVLVGGTAEELQDTKFTPFYKYEGQRRKMPGVEVHANALNTILTKSFLRRLPRSLSILLVLMLIGAVSWFVYLLKPLKAGVVLVFLLLLYSAMSFILFSYSNLIMPFMTPVLGMLTAFMANTAYLFFSEQQEKLRYRRIFQQYVSRNVVEEMLDTEQYPEFGGERRRLTVLFSDICSFTNFSEKNAPEVVVSRLFEYLSEMSEIIIKHDGTLDKFVGDEIMAEFGAPLYYPNHAEKACFAAYEIIRALRARQEEYQSRGEEYFDIGIGLNTGDMVVGNLGSRQLFDYTVIGDAVNLGARLEGLTRFYKVKIILSEATKKEAGKRVITRKLDRVKVKGKEEPIFIYELLGIGGVDPDVERWKIEAFHRGLEYYARQKWYQCIKEMNDVLHYFPDDGPAQIYIKRCLEMIENPPAPDWQPVEKFESK